MELRVSQALQLGFPLLILKEVKQVIIKNIGSKIVSIGSDVLMPDAQLEVSEAIASAPSIKAMEELGFLRVDRTPAPKDVVVNAPEENAGTQTPDNSEKTNPSQAPVEHKEEKKRGRPSVYRTVNPADAKKDTPATEQAAPETNE